MYRSSSSFYTLGIHLTQTTFCRCAPPLTSTFIKKLEGNPRALSVTPSTLYLSQMPTDQRTHVPPQRASSDTQRLLKIFRSTLFLLCVFCVFFFSSFGLDFSISVKFTYQCVQPIQTFASGWDQQQCGQICGHCGGALMISSLPKQCSAAWFGVGRLDGSDGGA